jgi:glycolate oxidase FAD binding subunit
MPIHDDPLIANIQQVLQSGRQQPILPVGSGTKTGLLLNASATLLKMTQYQGIVTYDSSEFLITAKAGTSITEIQDALKRHGQYLPFDPLFEADGATIGGTIASGISGPDRLLYGGVRDFVMEVAMIDGLGNFVRGGGKVVKNAAGFDSPKMMVGSYGRMGVLTEVTLKVFPAPQAYAAIQISAQNTQQAVALCQQVLGKPFPIVGIEIHPDLRVVVRVAAPTASLAGAVGRIEQLLAQPVNGLFSHEYARYDQLLRDGLQSNPGDNWNLIRVALAPPSVVLLHKLLDRLNVDQWVICGAGTVAWVKLPTQCFGNFDEGLRRLKLSAITVRGSNVDFSLGDTGWQQMASRIQKAIDPKGRFVAWPANQRLV